MYSNYFIIIKKGVWVLMYIKLLTGVVVLFIIFGSVSVLFVTLSNKNKGDVQHVQFSDIAIVKSVCGYMMFCQVIAASFIANGINIIISHINPDISFIVGLIVIFAISTIMVRINVTFYKDNIVKRWGDSDTFEEYSTLHYYFYSIIFYIIYITMYILVYHDYI